MCDFIPAPKSAVYRMQYIMSQLLVERVPIHGLAGHAAHAVRGVYCQTWLYLPTQQLAALAGTVVTHGYGQTHNNCDMLNQACLIFSKKK